ncbi:MAG: hypothetical protein LBH04_03325 [Tannerellaceae bacterium]|nr:hypothetical protein [Tannerellaceae bacterium]
MNRSPVRVRPSAHQTNTYLSRKCTGNSIRAFSFSGNASELTQPNLLSGDAATASASQLTDRQFSSGSSADADDSISPALVTVSH